MNNEDVIKAHYFSSNHKKEFLKVMNNYWF